MLEVFIACRPGFLIGAHISIGYYCALATFIFLIYSIYLYVNESIQAKYIIKFLGMSLVLHPAWTISASGGDCGCLKRDISYLIILVAFVLFLWQYLKSMRAESP